MPDIPMDIANTVIGLMPYIVVLIIILAIIIFLARRKGKKEEDVERPPIIEPEEVFLKAHKNLLRSQGSKIRHKSFVKIGSQEVCLAKRVMSVYIPKGNEFKLKDAENVRPKKNYSKEIKIMESQIKELKDNQIDTSKVDNDLNLLKSIVADASKKDNHYIIETLPFGIINALLYAFGYRMNYYYIPFSMVNTENSSNFNLPQNVYGKPYFDRVYVFSEAAHSYVQDFHDHMTLKQTLKEQVNFIPQMHYFDYKTGRFAAKSQEIARIKQKHYKDREAKFGGSEIPEDESIEE